MRHRRNLAALLAAVGLAATTLATPAAHADTGYQLQISGIQIAGPDKPADAPAWLAAMKQWRADTRARIGYDGSNYTRPQLAWAQHDPIQPQMMVHDLDFYDRATGRYTVGKYLADVTRRYGGIDSVLVWPTYPNIGVDDRNTVEMIRDMPGGIPGLRRMVADFHRHGVKVLFPIHPWDVGTHDPGQPWSGPLAKTMAEIGADGLNGDTMGAVTKDYFTNSVADGNPLVLEPEGGINPDWGANLSAIEWNVQSWGYWNYTSHAPMVSLTKWLEPRHTVHVNDRWSKSKIDMLQAAFFNGTGLESWENVWGIWNQMTARDDAATRRVASIEREFPDLLVSEGWQPYAPTLQDSNVYASKWPGAGSQTLWTLVNRGTSPTSGDQLTVDYTPGLHYYDVWHGVELHPVIHGDTATLAFPIEGNGFGAVLASTTQALPSGFAAFLTKMHTLTRRPLASYSAANTVLPQTMTPVGSTLQRAHPPTGMVAVPGGDFPFDVSGTEIEGGNMPGVDVQYPWESQPDRYHSHVVAVRPFYIGRTEVTNAQYQKFIDATHYRPRDSHNFLKDWNWQNPQHPQYKPGWADKPVTWVSLEDARAYARWAHQRLPNEWEWQYAAQGLDGRNYPWGNTFDPSRVPATSSSRAGMPAPANVGAHPSGASPFGALDMVGNVWQWTNQFTDEHTSTAVLRGGSYYRPQGSSWYFPSDQNAYRLDHHNKYLLMAPSLDRAATIGFRTVEDAPGPAPAPAVNGTMVDDTAPGWTIHGWSRYNDAGAFQGSGIGGPGSSGQYAQYTFTGTGVDVYGWRGPNGGTVQIAVDGKPYATDVSEYAATSVYHQLLARIGGLPAGSHTLTVATAPATTSAQWTMVDYLRVYNGAQPPAPPTVMLDHRLVAPGGTIRATVSFTNASAQAVSGAITLAAPSGTQVGGSGQFTDLAPHQTTTATFTVRPPDGTTGGLLLRAVAAVDGQPAVQSWVTAAVLGQLSPLTATGDKTNSIELSWPSLDPQGDAVYQVYGSTDPHFVAGPATLLTSTTATTFRHDGLAPNQTWYYQVRATDGAAAVGPLSSTASATSGPTILIEAESLVPLTDASAPYVVQSDCCGVHWSDGKQIWFQANGVGDHYTLTFAVPAAGDYDLRLAYTLAPDFGIHTQTLDGTPLGGAYDHYNAGGVAIEDHDYGTVHLTAGNHTLTFTITGKDAASPRYGFGLDAIQLTPTG